MAWSREVDESDTSNDLWAQTKDDRLVRVLGTAGGKIVWGIPDAVVTAPTRDALCFVDPVIESTASKVRSSFCTPSAMGGMELRARRTVMTSRDIPLGTPAVRVQALFRCTNASTMDILSVVTRMGGRMGGRYGGPLGDCVHSICHGTNWGSRPNRLLIGDQMADIGPLCSGRMLLMTVDDDGRRVAASVVDVCIEDTPAGQRLVPGIGNDIGGGHCGVAAVVGPTATSSFGGRRVGVCNREFPERATGLVAFQVLVPADGVVPKMPDGRWLLGNAEAGLVAERSLSIPSGWQRFAALGRLLFCAWRSRNIFILWRHAGIVGEQAV